MSQTPKLGTIGWFDLTVPDAKSVRAFYQAVVGWTSSDVSMGDYQDFCMHPPEASSAAVAGICHARGQNAGLPAQWLLYITVADLEASLTTCIENGGEVLSGPRTAPGSGQFAVIRDPAGAVAALYQTGPTPSATADIATA
jgi:predicted enzyme related to lactoylglutathione lyase